MLFRSLQDKGEFSVRRGVDEYVSGLTDLALKIARIVKTSPLENNHSFMGGIEGALITKNTLEGEGALN